MPHRIEPFGPTTTAPELLEAIARAGAGATGTTPEQYAALLGEVNGAITAEYWTAFPHRHHVVTDIRLTDADLVVVTDRITDLRNGF